MTIESMFATLENATRSHADAQERLERSQTALLDARDALLDTFASALLESPEKALQDVSEVHLTSLLSLAYFADQFAILHTPNPSQLPGANQSYCYQFPDSPTSRLLTAFSKSANTLGFTLSFTHFLTKRYRGKQLKTGSVNLIIRDTKRSEEYRSILTKVINAATLLPDTVFFRIKMTGTDVISEYSRTNWYMYRNGLEILLDSPPMHYRIYDGLQNPLDFMKKE